MTEFVDELLRTTDDIEVNDLATLGASDDVHDDSETRLDGIAGDDDRPGTDTVEVDRSIAVGPDVAGLVDLVEVGRQGDDDVLLLGRSRRAWR